MCFWSISSKTACIWYKAENMRRRCHAAKVVSGIKKKTPTSAANGTCVCWIHHFTFGSERIAGVYTKVLRANACSWKTISSPLPAPSIIQHPDWFCASVSEEYKYSQTVHGFQMFLNLWALWCALSLCVESSVIPCLWHTKIIEEGGRQQGKVGIGVVAVDRFQIGSSGVAGVLWVDEWWWWEYSWQGCSHT